MPVPLPDLSLSHGQALWALSYGTEPTQRMRDRARYLRHLGIPYTAEQQTVGRGNRMIYDYFQLVEIGFGLTALNLGSRPADLVKVLVGQREQMRPAYAEAYLEMPADAMTAEWVKSRGRIKPLIEDEYFLRVHDRHSELQGEFSVITPGDGAAFEDLLEPVEYFPGEPARRIIPMRRLILQWIAWALEAPPIKPGRK